MDENRDVVIALHTGMLVLEGTSPPTIYGFVTVPDPDRKGIGKFAITHIFPIS